MPVDRPLKYGANGGSPTYWLARSREQHSADERLPILDARRLEL